MAISSVDPSKDPAVAGSVIARDGAAVAATALAIGLVISQGLSPIVAGAGPPVFLIGILVVAWPAAIVARARGHHGVLKASGWGACLAAPLAVLALVTGAFGEAVISVGTGAVGGALTWLMVKAQALVTLPLPKHYRGAGRYVLATLIGAGVIVFLVQWLTPRAQPESIQTVAAIEVPLRTPADRADLLAMLNRHAREGGLHVDDVSKEWIEFGRRAARDEPPSARSALTKTIYVGVWRGGDDNDPEVFVDDGGHLGRAWLTFLRGDHPELATKTRTRLLTEIKARWPEARDVPVLPNGGLPNANDLVWTGTSYVVKPERVADYAR